jgi:hypothetical protein
MTNEPTPETDAKLAEARALLGLLADIRAAVGDPTGKLMQDELVERCRKLRADNELLRAERDALRNPAGSTIADGGEWTREEAIEMHRRKAEALLKVTAERDAARADNRELKELLLLLARAIHDENWKEIGNLVPRMTAAFAAPAK